MHITRHAGHRMSHRGIPGRLVEFALEHGRIEGDKCVLDRKESRRLLARLTEDMRLAKHILDKGGIAVVECENRVITTYNLAQRQQRAARKQGVPRKFMNTQAAVLAGGFGHHPGRESGQQPGQQLRQQPVSEGA